VVRATKTHKEEKEAADERRLTLICVYPRSSAAKNIFVCFCAFLWLK
jgi:hypothetical protein